MKPLTEVTELTEEELNEDYEEALGPEDYAFIIDNEGNLKSFYMPEEFTMDHPAIIKKIMKLFGYKNIHDFEDGGNTLH